jgi:ABC-2 type transport system permease protein
MNTALLWHTWRRNRGRLLVICIASAAWGALSPIIYASFGSTFAGLVQSGALPEAMANFAGGDIFSLAGVVALAFIHPIAILLVSIFGVGFASGAVAGERQRGTLEVLLSRPLSRHGLYATLLLCALAFVGLVLTALLAGVLVSAALLGVLGEIELGRAPLVWLNAFLLYGAFAAIAMAASVSCDRSGRALGATIAVVLASYFLEVLGGLWPDAAFLRPYSLFHYLHIRRILGGDVDPLAFVLLAVVAIAAVGLALFIFPRRDLAAPS